MSEARFQQPEVGPHLGKPVHRQSLSAAWTRRRMSCNGPPVYKSGADIAGAGVEPVRSHVHTIEGWRASVLSRRYWYVGGTRTGLAALVKRGPKRMANAGESDALRLANVWCILPLNELVATSGRLGAAPRGNSRGIGDQMLVGMVSCHGRGDKWVALAGSQL